MATRAKTLEFETTLAEDGSFTAAGAALSPPAEWSAEALVLAGLIRCSLASLRFHAQRAGFAVGATSAGARGAVTRRDADERYAFTEIDVELTATLEPAPTQEQVADLVVRAERGCFVGASLVAKPRYTWHVS
jgi:organic hydroperoxide reductase OsmC/OhrA